MNALVASSSNVDDDFFEELTDILIMADSGVQTAEKLVDSLKERLKEQKVRDTHTAREMFKQLLIEHMDIPRPPLGWPMVMLVVGVNGVGKTTTVGKLALRFKEIGHSVVLAAADTWLPPMNSLPSGPSALTYRLFATSTAPTPRQWCLMPCSPPKKKPIWSSPTRRAASIIKELDG